MDRGDDPSERSKVLKVNNDIARCAKRKEFAEAFVLYENALHEGACSNTNQDLYSSFLDIK